VLAEEKAALLIHCQVHLDEAARAGAGAVAGGRRRDEADAERRGRPRAEDRFLDGNDGDLVWHLRGARYA
jgi:hypothetical protein